MSSLSKLAKQHIGQATCLQIVHPETSSCLKSLLADLVPVALSNFKLFFPILLVRIGMNLKCICDKKIIYDILKHYLNLVISGFVLGFGSITFGCILWKCFGPRNFLTSIFLPCVMISSIYVNLAPEYVLNLASISAFEMVIEILTLMKCDPITKLIIQSKFLQTLLFMACSCYIIKNVLKHKVNMYWFIKPASGLQKEALNEISFEQKEICHRNLCSHNGSCKTYFFDGLKFYGIAGLCLDIVKEIGSSNKVKGLPLHLIKKFKTFDFQTTKFLLFYVGIFRFINCWLNNFHGIENLHRNTTIAAFLSGISYTFFPKFLPLSYGMACCVRIAWTHYKKKSTKSRFQTYIKGINWNKLTVALAIPLAIHLYMYEQKIVGSIGTKFISHTTNQRSLRVRENIKRYLSQFQ
ncbi:uncharacterized protein LOC129612210 [Condylostylus longicornis]|uniref:uncharacterized protein LOC129612210 n=1 Tax=Condylostylus longicornis TaxID=2530218 RepID=UPI00244DD019|nr:uncharacterized protein LOC129612210 [Condylostylus longicornis]